MYMYKSKQVETKPNTAAEQIVQQEWNKQIYGKLSFF